MIDSDRDLQPAVCGLQVSEGMTLQECAAVHHCAVCEDKLLELAQHDDWPEADPPEPGNEPPEFGEDVPDAPAEEG